MPVARFVVVHLLKLQDIARAVLHIGPHRPKNELLDLVVSVQSFGRLDYRQYKLVDSLLHEAAWPVVLQTLNRVLESHLLSPMLGLLDHMGRNRLNRIYSRF